ncbi:BBSome complex assembly protein BBS10 isoform X4 [Xiphophorus couchianus]|uniref:BBSome complex assembly protein BBS10 isoform X4 n=1 Tax=Xiphophorus couchianus TaxID=32473 RepID=UPI0010162C34|nr:Bardet-Biedl syndrome 10 protein isoform X4 [Xiphophorus couchianus]
MLSNTFQRAKMVPLEQLHLNHVLQTVSALESVILRSFGPEGGQVLFTRDTGQVMLSRSGKRILTALHLDHPLARYVHLDFHDCEERLKVKPCSLVICAPSEGQADQHACAFQDALRMLLTALEPMHKTQTALKKTIPSEECTSLHTDNISNEAACRVHLHQKCVIETGCVISAGGTFEFLLHHALHQYGHSCSVSVNTSAVSQLLAKALLSVPRQIYSHNLKHFLQAQTRVMALIPRQPNALSTNLIHTEGPLADGKLSLCSCNKGNMSLKLLDLGFESVSCKYQLVLAVLQCLTNLLRMNMLLRTHTILHTKSHNSLNAHSESSEDEDED